MLDEIGYYSQAGMELYHQTLSRPSVASHVMALHLHPIKPREDQEKPKQLCLCKTSSLQIYHIERGSQRNDFRIFHQEELFSSVCAAEAIIYQDEQMRKDIIIVTLGNGKYQLLEWRQQSSRFAILDQNMIFSDEQEVMSGLAKPTLGHYIAVNNEAKLVMIAAANWQFKLFLRDYAFTGIRLSPLLYFQQPMEMTSICLGLVAGAGNPSLFYSLRLSQTENGTVKKRVHKLIKTNQQKYEEEIYPIEDISANLLIARGGDSNFIVVGQKDIHLWGKGKLSSIRFTQQRQGLQATSWKRQQRDRKQQIFLMNQFGEIHYLSIDDGNLLNSQAIYIDMMPPVLTVAVFEKNLFYALSATEDNYLFQFAGKFKPDDKLEKTRSAKLSREEQMRQEALLSKNQSIKEIQIVGRMESSRQIRDMKIANLQKAMNSQLSIAGGRAGGKKGFLNILKYGLKVTAMPTINTLAPVGIWCLKKSVNDKYHSYVVISYQSRKTITYIFETKNKLSMTTELKFQDQELTFHVARLVDNSLVQVMAYKIRHIREGSVKDIPIRGRIMKATASNEGRQLAISLIGGFMVYYQLSSRGDLDEFREFQLDSQASQLDFSPIQPNGLGQGLPGSRILVLGKTNYFVTVYTSAGSGKGFSELFSRNIRSSIESVVIVPSENGWTIHISTHTGRIIKMSLNKAGEEINTEDVIIGEKPVKIARIHVQGKPSVMRTQPQVNINYLIQGQIYHCTLSLPSLELLSEILIEGLDGTSFVTYYDGYLQFVEISGFGNLLHQVDKDLEMPAKKLLIIDDRLGILLESRIKTQEKQTWISKFLLMNPLSNYNIEKNLSFGDNEKCLSACWLPREDGRNYICFGCAIGVASYPTLSYTKPTIKVYGYEKGEKQIGLVFLYSLDVEQIPSAMDVYDEKLLIGMGKKLRLYEVTRNKLVLRAQKSGLSSPINHICSEGQKIFTTQTMNSFTLFRHNPQARTFEYVGEDILPRFVTAAQLIDGDYGVIAGGDKFGNFFVSKLSERIKQEFYAPTSQRLYNELTDIAKFDSLVAFHCGQVITAIQTGHIDDKKTDSIFYATIDGRIGMFYPFQNEQDPNHATLLKLQTELAKCNYPGSSNHAQYRSFFHPSKGVIDGDFCNLFNTMIEPERQRVATNLAMEQKEIASLLTLMQSKFT